MMKPLLTIHTCLLALLLFGGCDSGPRLTPVTQEGKNTFSCRINGKVWVPRGSSGMGGEIKPVNGGFLRNVITDESNISIKTYSSTGTSDQVDLFLVSYETGRHLLNRATAEIGVSLSPESYGRCQVNGKTYMTNESFTGWINLVKADINTGIIAGTFEFTAVAGDGETVRITDGRFDIKSPL